MGALNLAARASQPKRLPVRAIAAYLPQYHPVAENDRWWGPGFSEWTNVAAARPLYPGHYQPHLPGELGFYDLRLEETRVRQAELAHNHSIEAFCYWHYWFAGKRMLETVVDSVVKSGVPDFPFCLGWANASWNSSWDMAGRNVRLIEQTYPGVDDSRRHFECILPALSDRRYLTVDGKPVFIVHQPTQLPSPARFAERWRAWAQAAGLPGLYLAGFSRPELSPFDPLAAEFDAAITSGIPPTARRRRRTRRRTHLDLVVSELANRSRALPGIYSYQRWIEDLPFLQDGPSIPTVWVNWDNTPRRRRDGFTMHNATPELFGLQVEVALNLIAGIRAEERLLFVRSWNEWAEGNHLEPDRRFGRGHLEAFRDAVSRFGADQTAEQVSDHGGG